MAGPGCRRSSAGSSCRAESRSGSTSLSCDPYRKTFFYCNPTSVHTYLGNTIKVHVPMYNRCNTTYVQ